MEVKLHAFLSLRPGTFSPALSPKITRNLTKKVETFT